MKFNKSELRMLKFALQQQMLSTTKDLSRRIKESDYDEIDLDISWLDDYRKLLRKIVVEVAYGKE